MKTSVSPRSSPLETFRAEERLRLSDRNSIQMTQSVFTGSHGVPKLNLSPAAKSEEKRMFSQATLSGASLNLEVPFVFKRKPH